jgi:hypothetical protein
LPPLSSIYPRGHSSPPHLPTSPPLCLPSLP